MGIREKINQKPGLSGGILIGLIAVVLGFVLLVIRPLPERAASAYYSDDLGKTYFSDDIDKVFPFDHNGKQAYRAYVYRFGNGQPFVAYLARYNDSARARLPELLSRPKDPQAQGELAGIRASGIEVCKVGTTDWVSMGSAKGAEVASHPMDKDGNRATNISP